MTAQSVRYVSRAWNTVLRCGRCGDADCACSARTRATQLIQKYGRDTMFCHTSFHEPNVFHTLVTLALVECDPDISLPLALAQRGVPWLVRHPIGTGMICPLSHMLTLPGWRATLDRWIAVGFDVNYRLAGGQTLLTTAVTLQQPAETITVLVCEYGCDAMVLSETDNHGEVTSLWHGVDCMHQSQGLALLRARAWPPELARDSEEYIMDCIANRAYQPEAAVAFMRYVRTMQMRNLVLACRRRHRSGRRGHWLPAELWRLVFFEFLLGEQ